jgi:hypothetical protein
MNQRGEGNSTAIVAIVVLVLVSLFVFFTFFGEGPQQNAGLPKEVNIDIDKPAPGQ